MQNMLKRIRDFIVKWSCTTNHKQIGTLYMLLGGFSGIVAMVLSMSISFELAPNRGLIFKGNAHKYNAVVTSHTLVMIFSFVIPTLIGRFVNWMIPGLVSARGTAFPQLNSLNFWLLPWSFWCGLNSTFIPYRDWVRHKSFRRFIYCYCQFLIGGSSIVGATIITIHTILALRSTVWSLSNIAIRYEA